MTTATAPTRKKQNRPKAPVPPAAEQVQEQPRSEAEKIRAEIAAAELWLTALRRDYARIEQAEQREAAERWLLDAKDAVEEAAMSTPGRALMAALLQWIPGLTDQARGELLRATVRPSTAGFVAFEQAFKAADAPLTVIYDAGPERVAEVLAELAALWKVKLPEKPGSLTRDGLVESIVTAAKDMSASALETGATAEVVAAPSNGKHRAAKPRRVHPAEFLAKFPVKDSGNGEAQQAAPAKAEQRDAALRAALHFTGGAEERWKERRATGLADDELLAAAGSEFGIDGGSSGGGDLLPFAMKGGKKPRIWIGSRPAKDKPTLAGPELVAAVRALLNIPPPAAESAPETRGPARTDETILPPVAGILNGSLYTPEELGTTAKLVDHAHHAGLAKAIQQGSNYSVGEYTLALPDCEWPWIAVTPNPFDDLPLEDGELWLLPLVPVSRVMEEQDGSVFSGKTVKHGGRDVKVGNLALGYRVKIGGGK